MICRTCGTEIADKALICFRCGTPTSLPQAPAPQPARRPLGTLLTALVLVALVFAALFLGQAGQLQLPPAISYTVAGLAALILVLRVWRRRRR